MADRSPRRIPATGVDARTAVPRLRRGVAALACALAAAGVVAHDAGARPALPDGRGYELVSLPNADGSSVAKYGFTAVLGNDRLLWSAGLQPLGDPAAGGSPVFLSQRTATGWQNTQLDDPGLSSARYVAVVDQATANGALLATAAASSFAGNGGAPKYDLGTETLLRDASGTWHTLESNPGGSADPSDPSVQDPTQSGSLSADGSAASFTSAGPPPGFSRLIYGGKVFRAGYLYRDGTTIRVDGAPGDPTYGCQTAVAGTLSTENSSGGTNAVSADGRSVFFEVQHPALQNGAPVGPANCPGGTDFTRPAGENTQQLYLNRAGTIVPISVPTDGTPAPADGTSSLPQRAAFLGATPDASRAWFATAEQLTQDATGGFINLYEWDAAAGGRPASVRCISCSGGAGATTDVNNTRVSPTGGYVYFDAPGPIDGQGAAGESDLFVLHDGSVRLVFPDPSTQAAYFSTSNHEGNVILYSAGPDYQHQALYRTVVEPTGVDTTCVSCAPDGTLQPGTYDFAPSDVSDTEVIGGASDVISDDGDTIAFQSAAALAPGTAAGTTKNYRWRAGQGVALISEQPSYTRSPKLSRDGSDLFFNANAPLVDGTDGLGTATIYDARIGGGFPGATVPPTCAGDACQGAATAPPTVPGTGSESSRGGDIRARNDGVPKIPRLSVRRPSAGARASLVAGRRIALVVSARGRGTVRAVATARMGARTRRIAGASGRSRSADHARTLRLGLRLSAGARRALAGGDRLTTTIAVTLAGARTQHLQLTLQSKRGHR